MRLHRLTLHDVRGVTDRTVTFTRDGATAGVVVVEGWNEAGKSTLGDALDVLLSYRDSSRAAEVRSLQSAGRDAPPEVIAELELGGHRFTYRKRFLKRPETELVLTAPRADRHAGDAAHAWVDTLLDTHLDRGLWSALQLRQAEGLEQPATAGARGLAAALSARSDASAIGDRELAILEQIQAEYERYYTARAGSPRPILRDAEAEVAAREAELAALDHRRQELQQDVERADRLARSLPTLTEQVTVTAAQAREHEQRRDQIAALDAEVGRRRTDVEQARATHERLTADRDRRSTQVAELADIRAEEAAHLAALTEADAAVERAAQRVATARTDLAAATDARRRATAARVQAQADVDHLADLVTLAGLQARLQRLAAAEEAVADHRSTLARLTVDEDLLRELRVLQTTLTRAEATRDAAAPQLRITPARELEVQLDGTTEYLPPGEPRNWTVSDHLTVHVGELGTVEVRAGAGSGDAMETHARAAAALTSALERAGVADVAAAETALRQRDEAARALAEAERARIAALEGEDPAVLTERAAALHRSTEHTAHSRSSDPAAPALPSDLPAARRTLDAAIEAEGRSDGEVAEPESALERWRTELERERSQAVERRTLAGTSRTQATTLESLLEQRRTALPDTELHSRVAAAATELHRESEELATAQAALAAADPAGVRELADNAVAVARDADDRLRTAEQELRDTRVRISALGGDGLWEQREQVATELAHTQDELAGHLRRATAARTLLTALHRHRDLARDRYAAPLRAQLLTYGRMLHGAEFDVELDEDLRIARRRLDDLWLDVGQLSVGAREQLALLNRLACTTLLGDEGGLLFLDDALGNTDPDRLERLGAVLRRAGQEAQIVVLTSYPERYRHVGGALRVRL